VVDTATSSSTEDPLQDTVEPSAKFVAPVKRESRKSGKWQRERGGRKKPKKNGSERAEGRCISPVPHGWVEKSGVEE